MNILWVSHSSSTFGAERTIFEAIPGLIANGHQVRIILPAAEKMAREWCELAAPVERVDMRWWMNSGGWKARELASSIRRGPPAIQSIRGIISDWNVDLVVTNSMVVPVGAAAAWLSRKPHVWLIQEFGERDHNLSYQFGRTITHRFISATSKRVIVHSKAVLKMVQQFIDPTVIDLVPYAVDIAQPASESHDAPPVIVGRISESKGQEDAIRAIALLHSWSRPVSLDIVGPDNHSYVARLKSLTHELGVQDWIRFTGASDSPQDWFGRSRVALVCSREEAFGRVTVEAMKSGAPVIGADSGGTAELIDHGVTGLKYPPGDVGQLAKALDWFMGNEGKAAAMGGRAKRWATSRFTQEGFVRGLLQSFAKATS